MMEGLTTVRWVIWTGGIGAWIFGLCDRSFAALSDGHISAIDLVLLFTASLVAFGWLTLIPMSSSAAISAYEQAVRKLRLF